MDDTTRAFRNAMAETGIEYTPSQVAGVIESVESFRKNIHDRFREAPEHYENLKNLTMKEKQDLCRQFRETGQEVTVDKLDELIVLILKIYEGEKLY